MKPVAKMLLLLPACLAVGCLSLGPPEGVRPVRGFDVSRYLGTWYEIARLDHSFEHGLTDVTATYRLRDDGAIAVINRGYDSRDDEWEEARGTARFIGSRDIASLKVAFFWPFYGGYHVIALDKEDYSHALVTGPNRGYLWLLSRTPRMDEPTKTRLVREADRLGYDVEDLIWVPQDKHL